jgi:hypothetical protein
MNNPVDMGNAVGQIREEAECGLQALVEALQEDTSSTKARLLDCQDMLAELQAFSEDRMIELAAVKAESEVKPEQFCCKSGKKLRSL